MIVITRYNSRIDKFRSYVIHINGKAYAKIKNNSKVEIKLPKGEYEVYLSIDWCKSNKMTINVEENNQISLECYPYNMGKSFFRNLLSFLNNTNNYIVLDWNTTI